MYRKAWCTCKPVVLLNTPIAVLTVSLPSPLSLLKLPDNFDTRNGFSGSERGSGRIEVCEKMLTDSPLLSSCRFSFVRYFTARLIFSLVCTDREPGTGYFQEKTYFRPGRHFNRTNRTGQTLHSQSSLRWTPLEPAPSVHLRELSVLLRVR